MYITGNSGTGKSSIAKALSAQGIKAIDIDDNLCHWENKYTHETVGLEPGSSDEWHEAHDWVCDIERLKKMIGIAGDVVVVGCPANQDECLDLFDKFFVLQCRPETIVTRIQQRDDNDFGKHPAEQKRILDWQKTFDDEMIQKGATPLDAERPLSVVAAEIAHTIRPF